MDIHPADDHAHYVKKWRLHEPLPLADTPTGKVWKVLQENGEPAVLKLLKPRGTPQEIHGADFLQNQKGHGCVHLLKREGTVFLIEYAGSHSLRDHLAATGDGPATNVICEVIRQIHAFDAPHRLNHLPSLKAYFISLTRKAEAELAANRPGFITIAADLLDRLATEQRNIRPLHGDIHHENIIWSKQRGWLAIDPGSLTADPAYETSNVFFNPGGFEKLVQDPERIRFLAKTFADLLDRSTKTILQYAFAHACLSASWAEEDGRNPTSRLAAASLIHSML